MLWCSGLSWRKQFCAVVLRSVLAETVLCCGAPVCHGGNSSVLWCSGLSWWKQFCAVVLRSVLVETVLCCGAPVCHGRQFCAVVLRSVLAETVLCCGAPVCHGRQFCAVVLRSVMAETVLMVLDNPVLSSSRPVFFMRGNPKRCLDILSTNTRTPGVCCEETHSYVLTFYQQIPKHPGSVVKKPIAMS